MRALNRKESFDLLKNRNDIHSQLIELQADFEDLNDKEFVENRNVMLTRVNYCLELILETNEDNEW